MARMGLFRADDLRVQGHAFFDRRLTLEGAFEARVPILIGLHLGENSRAGRY